LDESADGSPPSALQQRRHYARWFIMMRGIAVIVAGAAVFAAIAVAEVLSDRVALVLGGLVALLATLNAAYALVLTRAEPGTRFLAVQVYGDLAVLILLLHFSGGIENPLTTLLLLHVIIAGIVLGRRHAYLVAGVAILLYATMAVGEWSRALEHYTLTIFPHPVVDGRVVHAAHDAVYVGSAVVLHAILLLLVASFTTTLVERIRQDERQLRGHAERAVAQAAALERALVTQREAQSQALRAARLAAVGELAGQVAHEVNNPIAIMSAKARLLLRQHEQALPPAVAVEIGKIAEQSDRVARIAQGLLSYCRPAPGARSALDVRVPIRRALAYVDARAAAAGVRVSDELPGSLPHVRANAPELEQVFLNLFLNALDAMPAGGTLRVAAHEERHGAEAALAVEVHDTGAGIPDDIRSRIFEPFLTTKGHHGSGLGLSICQGLVGSHGGVIEVESRVGHGTRMTVRLPAEERAPVPVPDPVLAAAPVPLPVPVPVRAAEVATHG
ncbi:MAG TPA: ATP-binding protein, partial [Gemmatimonadaceae bacterium]